MKTNTLASLLPVVARALLVAATPFMAVACCSDVKDPDTRLQVEVLDGEAPVSTEAGDELPTVCGANVVAVDSTGKEIALEEAALENADGSSRCVYRGEVDPAQIYTIKATLEDKDGNIDGESNPACSVATDPEDTDAQLSLKKATSREQEAAALRAAVNR